MNLTLKKHLSKERGQGLAEYALILVLVSVFCIALLTLLSGSVNGLYCHVIGILGGECPAGESASDTTWYGDGLYAAHGTAEYAFRQRPIG